jgi:tyrosine-protein kinase Etk/Wzc
MKDILVRQSGTSPAETAKLDAQIDAKKKELVALIVGDTQFSGAETNKDLSQIKTIQENRITEELNVYVLTNREKYYQALIVDFRKNHPNIVENAILFIRLSRAKTVAENLYNFLLEKGEEAKIRAASTSGGIRIVDAPMLPEAPMSRGTVRNLLLGLILGLGLGFGAALTAEYLDNSIQNHEQITEAFNIPVMGTIPAFSDIPKRIRRRKASHGHGPTRRPELTPTDGKGPLITIMSPKSPAVEAYRTLRANLQFASVDTAIKSMLVTSPSPGEGKSVTSANLAIAFALLGDKVLLVDCDLRKPVVHNLFPVQKTPGLSNCLVEKMPLKAVIQESGVQNLNILSAGTMPPNPAEMLASKGMQHLMEELKREFNLVVFDTPPVLPVADAVMLASRTDGVLLVFKHQQTRMDLAAMALQSLSRGSGRMLGAVLNFTRVQRGYGYYYRYYAKEYYSH